MRSKHIGLSSRSTPASLYVLWPCLLWLDLLQLYLLWHLGLALENHARLENHIPLDRQLVALNHRRRAW